DRDGQTCDKIGPRERSTRDEGMSCAIADGVDRRPPVVNVWPPNTLGALPSPLWGGVGGGGGSCCAVDASRATTTTPTPSPSPASARLRASSTRFGGGEQTERACRTNPNRTKGSLSFSLLISILALISFSITASAETLRVGKAGREAFSFVPADVGQR